VVRRRASVLSKACACLRYSLRSASPAIRAVRLCCAIGLLKSRRFQSGPSRQQSCFDFSMISSTVGSDMAKPPEHPAARPSYR
jgi:hypothetical protein